LVSRRPSSWWQLLTAKKDLRLDALLKKLDRFDAVILD
jgi:hypothetical protein